MYQFSFGKGESLDAISDLNHFYTHLVSEYYTQSPVLLSHKNSDWIYCLGKEEFYFISPISLIGSKKGTTYLIVLELDGMCELSSRTSVNDGAPSWDYH